MGRPPWADSTKEQLLRVPNFTPVTDSSVSLYFLFIVTYVFLVFDSHPDSREYQCASSCCPPSFFSFFFYSPFTESSLVLHFSSI